MGGVAGRRVEGGVLPPRTGDGGGGSNKSKQIFNLSLSPGIHYEADEGSYYLFIKYIYVLTDKPNCPPPPPPRTPF